MTTTDFESLDLSELFRVLVDADHLEALIALAASEDLGDKGDITTQTMVRPLKTVSAEIVTRQAGVLSGTPVLDVILRQLAPELSWSWMSDDGASIVPGDAICRINGPLDRLLPVERILLNMLGRLSGVATLTQRYVSEVDGTGVSVCDTRKTTPGFRSLEKYAVRCGGGTMHRRGLHDAILVKDNHVGMLCATEFAELLARRIPAARVDAKPSFVQIEVDHFDQLEAVLAIATGLIDIILLDNMSPEKMLEAVARRDQVAPGVLLEASGGITLETVRSVAESGVDRISVGALTHSALQLDFGLDLR
jgi:nicotinate-nucleotide pyrophosphorylase (carboxylating)